MIRVEINDYYTGRHDKWVAYDDATYEGLQSQVFYGSTADEAIENLQEHENG